MKMFAVVLTIMLVIDIIDNFFDDDNTLTIKLVDIFALIFIYLHFAG